MIFLCAAFWRQLIKKISLCGCFFVLSFLCAFPFVVSTSVHANEKQKQELQQVQNKIEAQQESISKRKKSLAQQQKKLKQSDVEIGRLSSLMRKNKQDIKQLKKQIILLEKKQKDLAKSKKTQQKALAKQIESAYRTGSYDYLKVLLNQQEPETIERTLIYFKYLNQARLERLDNLLITQEKIAANKEQLQGQTQELETRIVALKEQKQQIKKQKEQREVTLVKLKRLIGSEQEQLNQLQKSEIELQSKIKRALQKTQKVLHHGLKADKGKLPWPTKGRLVQSFGSRHAGSLKRKGIIIAAPEGRLVSAVQAGQVVFANWLKGFGLITVVDHGKGYLSLYAYNQSLLVEVGDRVAKGEAIATVGDSGGQSQSALYFELRYQGKPINPSHWLLQK